MNQFGTRFEIIEDEIPKRKQKRKLKNRLSLNYIPWRLMMIAVTAGMTIGIALIFFLSRSRLPSALVAISSDMAMGFEVKAPPNDIAFSDKDLTAVSTSGLVRVYSENALIQALKVNTMRLGLSPNGLRLAALAHVNDQNLLQLWNLETGELVNQTPVYSEFLPAMIPRNNIVFSPDGRLLAFGTVEGLLIMDAEMLEKRIAIPEDALDLIGLGPTAISISHDNQRVVAINHYQDYASNQYSTLVQVWDIQDPTTPQRIYSLPIADAFAQDAALTADGHYLAYTSRDDTTDRPIEVIHIHDLVSQKEVLAVPCEPYTHIGPIALSEGYIAFQQRGEDNTGNENSLQVARWSFSSDQVNFELLKKPQPLRALGVGHLQLHSENGSTVIDYLALDAHMLLRWDFNSNTIRTLPL